MARAKVTRRQATNSVKKKDPSGRLSDKDVKLAAAVLRKPARTRRRSK